MTIRADKEELSRAVARIRTGALALVCAMIGGGGLFLMTAWLLLKGGPHVGQHLQLLSQYFIGYSVTWWGTVVGFFYGKGDAPSRKVCARQTSGWSALLKAAVNHEDRNTASR
jgi:hypothetical protein